MNIEFKAGIPGKAVTHSFLNLGLGEHTYSAGDKAILTGSFSLATRSWTSTQMTWTENGEYSNADSIKIPGAPVWQRELKAGAVAIAKAKLPRTPENLNITIDKDAEVNNLVITVNGGNPLLPAAPNIDAELLLQIRPEPHGFAAKVTGTHDRFPAFTLKINGTVLYSFDPVHAGTDPDSLFGVVKETALTAWTVFAGS